MVKIYTYEKFDLVYNIISNLKMADRKAVVKNADMSEGTYTLPLDNKLLRYAIGCY